MKRLIGNILCKIFGHPDRKHYHRPSDVVWCNGGCEKTDIIYEVMPCGRCDHGRHVVALGFKEPY